MDLKLSYSKISTYLQCPYRYYLAYVVKLPTEPKPYFAFGHSLHGVLEWLHKPRILPAANTVDDLVEYYKQNWERAGYTSIEEEARYKEIGRSILISYWNKMNGEFKPAFDVEKRFQIKLNEVEGVVLTGVIDRIDLTDNNTLSLTDYKTGKWIPNNADEMDALQLTIYALASKTIWNKPVSKVSNLFLRELREVSFVPNEEKIAEAIKDIRYVSNGIKNKDYETKSNKFCNWCDYHARCKTTPVLSVESS